MLDLRLDLRMTRCIFRGQTWWIITNMWGNLNPCMYGIHTDLSGFAEKVCFLFNNISFISFRHMIESSQIKKTCDWLVV